jgi:putative oxidoreductase
MKAMRSLLTLIARWCLAAVFLFAGATKLIYFDQTQAYMASKGLTAIPLFLMGAALVELIGSLCLILGYKTRFGAAILLLFLIPTTFIFHDFWNASGAEATVQQWMFLKNVAIFGGLLYLLCDGPGGFACDAFCKFKHPPTETKV